MGATSASSPASRGNILSQQIFDAVPPWRLSWAAIVSAIMPLVAVIALKAELGMASAGAGRAAYVSMEVWPVRPYQRMTQRLGAEVFDRATLRVPLVAQQVWGAGGCDRVDVVTIANQSTPRAVVYRVACHNGHEAQLAIDFTTRAT